MSFLDKLKVKVESESQVETEIKDGKVDKNAGFIQLEVDIFQTADEIVVIAPIPGVDAGSIDISIENENDVVTIQGARENPTVGADDEVEERHYLRQENQWGRFYRQIILPQEINVAEVQARFKKGILILHLPLLRLQTGGKKKIEVEKN